MPFCAPAVHCFTHRALFGHFTSEWVHLLLNYAFAPPLILWFYITNMWFWFPQNKIKNFPWYCCLIAQLCLTLWPHGLQHTRLPCPSTSPRACSNSCPLYQWCKTTILASVILFYCLQSFPASQSFLMSWLFTSSGQSFGVSASAPVLLMNIHDWFPLGLTSLISLQSKGLSRVFFNTTTQKHQVFSIQPPLSIHDYWKNHSFH